MRQKVQLERVIINETEYWIGEMPDGSYGIFIWDNKGDHWEMRLIEIQFAEDDERKGEWRIPQ